MTELKARLAHYLRLVRRGTEVQVLERGVPIARLVGIEPATGFDAERLERAGESGHRPVAEAEICAGCSASR